MVFGVFWGFGHLLNVWIGRNLRNDFSNYWIFIGDKTKFGNIRFTVDTYEVTAH